MRSALVLLVLVTVTAACTPGSVYEACLASPSCLAALWQPTRRQFERFVRHVPLNCSSPAPELDLAARVRTRYTCGWGEYAQVDADGTLTCACPVGQVCAPPSEHNLVLSIMFGTVIIVLAAVVHVRSEAQGRVIRS